MGNSKDDLDFVGPVVTQGSTIESAAVNLQLLGMIYILCTLKYAKEGIDKREKKKYCSGVDRRTHAH